MYLWDGRGETNNMEGQRSEVSAGEVVHHGVLQSNGQHGAHYQQGPEYVGKMWNSSEKIYLKRE